MEIRAGRQPTLVVDLERFQAKWMPVRVKKTHRNKKVEPRF
jgi:hypothetical protein